MVVAVDVDASVGDDDDQRHVRDEDRWPELDREHELEALVLCVESDDALIVSSTRTAALASNTGMSPKTFGAALQDLAALGLVEITSAIGSRSPIFRLVRPPRVAPGPRPA